MSKVPNLYIIAKPDTGDIWTNSHGRATCLSMAVAEKILSDRIDDLERVVKRAKEGRVKIPPESLEGYRMYWESQLKDAHEWRVFRMTPTPS